MKWPFHRRARSCSLPAATRQEKHDERAHPPVPNYSWRGCGAIRTDSWNIEGGCNLQQGELFGTHAPQGEGDHSPDPKEDTGVVQKEISPLETSSVKEDSPRTSGEDNWASNPEFFSSGASASTSNIGCMDFPLRTIDRHLAELGQRALHKGFFLPSEDTVQADIRITGDQGQVWSTNPVFTKEDDTDSNHSLSPRLSQYPDLPQTKKLPASSLLDDSIPEGSSEEDEGYSYEQERFNLAKSYPQNLIFEVRKLGSPMADALKSVDFEVYTVDTPRFEMSNSSREEKIQFSRKMQDSGIQTDENMHKQLSTESALSTFVDQSASESELKELRNLQESIEKVDHEIGNLLSFISKELKGTPGRVSNAMGSVRMLQSMIEQKDLEIADLYRQMSQEMQHARQFQGLHMIQGNDTQNSEENSGGSDSRGLISPSFELASFNVPESLSTPFEQGVESPGNGGTPTSNFFPTALAFQDIASGIGGARVASPKMSRMMSGSDYYEVDLDCPSAPVTQLRFLDRIKQLEEEVMQKELTIKEKETEIKRLQHARKTDIFSSKVQNMVFPQVDLWRNPSDVEYSSSDASGPQQQDIYIGQQNPPWDSARADSLPREGNGLDDIITTELIMKVKKVANATAPKLHWKKEPVFQHL